MRNSFPFLVIAICLGSITGCAALQQANTNHTEMRSTQGSSSATQEQHLFEIARNHQQKNELTEALHVYEKVIDLAPMHYEAYNNMGMIYFMMGEDDLGFQLLNEAIRLAPQVSALHNNIGYALLKQGRHKEATEALQRALVIDPDNSHARNNLAAAYRQLGCGEGVPCKQ